MLPESVAHGASREVNGTLQELEEGQLGDLEPRRARRYTKETLEKAFVIPRVLRGLCTCRLLITKLSHHRRANSVDKPPVAELNLA